MTRQELLAIAKPILFNTEMVRAVLDNRKTVTRRVVKPHNKIKAKKLEYSQRDGLWIDNVSIKDYTISSCWIEKADYLEKYAPYKVGDYLYVRETWTHHDGAVGGIIFRARCPELLAKSKKWRPSIHMPKEAARLFLRVTAVRVELLQDITEEQAKAEGADYHIPVQSESGKSAWELVSSRGKFISLWDSTIKKSDLPLYGWDANPWIWVIEFEKVNADD